MHITIDFILTFVKKHSENPFAIDLRSIALARVGFALIILYDCIFTVFPGETPFFTGAGFFDRATTITFDFFDYSFSSHMESGQVWWQYLLLAAQIFFGLLLLTGFKTRLATLMTWMLPVSQYNQNYMVLGNAELLSRTLLFWAIFIPWGYRFSIDGALSGDDGKTSEKTAYRYVCMGSILFLGQGYITYFMAASQKNGPNPLTGALNYESMTTQLGPAIRVFFLNPHVIGDWLPMLVQAIGFCVPILLLVPMFNRYTRLLAVPMFVAFHAFLSLILDVGLFSAYGVAFWLAVIPPKFWSFMARRHIKTYPGANTANIFYDGNCGFCKKMVHILRSFMGHTGVRIDPAQNNAAILSIMERHNTWVITDRQKIYTKFDALIYLISISPIWRFMLPVVSLNLTKKIGDVVYGIVANRRKRMARLTSMFVFRPPPDYFYRKSKLVILFLLLFAFFFIYKNYSLSVFY